MDYLACWLEFDVNALFNGRLWFDCVVADCGRDFATCRSREDWSRLHPWRRFCTCWWRGVRILIIPYLGTWSYLPHPLMWNIKPWLSRRGRIGSHEKLYQANQINVLNQQSMKQCHAPINCRIAGVSYEQQQDGSSKPRSVPRQPCHAVCGLTCKMNVSLELHKILSIDSPCVSPSHPANTPNMP